MRIVGKKDAVTTAQQQAERGDVDGAGWTLWEERRRALSNSDAERLDEIDEVTKAMRARLQGDDRLPAFDAHLSGRETPLGLEPADHPSAAAELDDVTALSLGIALLGASVMLLAVFLPQFESNTFARIEKNSLVQNGDGWWFILLAVLAAGSAYRAYRGQRRSFAPVVLGVIGVALAIYYGASHSQRKLCSVIGGSGSNCTLATPGIGIYAAGVGGFLVVVGGLQIFRSRSIESEEEEDDIATGRAVGPPAAIADRLRTLDTLRADGLITDAEYAERRAALIAEV